MRRVAWLLAAILHLPTRRLPAEAVTSVTYPRESDAARLARLRLERDRRQAKLEVIANVLGPPPANRRERRQRDKAFRRTR